MAGHNDSLQLFAAFALALAAMVGFQIVRLHQTNAESWLLADYAGRLIGLMVLALMPNARRVAFAREPLAVEGGEVVAWIVGLVGFDMFMLDPLRAEMDIAFPTLRLAYHPAFDGTALLVDATFGLALVAFQEEVLFRRVSRAVFESVVRNRSLMIAASAVLFGLIHWQFGVGNVLAGAAFGVVAMIFYQRVGAIAPVVIAHYLIDLRAFVL